MRQISLWVEAKGISLPANEARKLFPFFFPAAAAAVQLQLQQPSSASSFPSSFSLTSQSQSQSQSPASESQSQPIPMSLSSPQQPSPPSPLVALASSSSSAFSSLHSVADPTQITPLSTQQMQLQQPTQQQQQQQQPIMIPSIPTTNLASRYFATAQAYPQHLSASGGSSLSSVNSTDELAVTQQMQQLGLQSPLIKGHDGGSSCFFFSDGSSSSSSNNNSAIPPSPRASSGPVTIQQSPHPSLSSPRITVVHNITMLPPSPVMVLDKHGITSCRPMPYYTPKVGSGVNGGSGVDPLFDMSAYTAAAGRTKPIPRSAPTALSPDGGLSSLLLPGGGGLNDLRAMPEGSHHKHHRHTRAEEHQQRQNGCRSGSVSPVSPSSNCSISATTIPTFLPPMPTLTSAAAVAAAASAQAPSLMEVYQLQHSTGSKSPSSLTATAGGLILPQPLQRPPLS